MALSISKKKFHINIFETLFILINFYVKHDTYFINQFEAIKIMQ